MEGIHLALLMHYYLCSYLLFFPSFLLIHLSIHDKKGKSILESIPECIVISIWLLCTFLGNKVLGEMHILKRRRHLLWENLVLSTLLYACFLVAIWCFELSLVSILCCSHCIVFMCWTCIHPYAIVLFWLHVQMIICFAMWPLWLFPNDCFVFD